MAKLGMDMQIFALLLLLLLGSNWKQLWSHFLQSNTLYVYLLTQIHYGCWDASLYVSNIVCFVTLFMYFLTVNSLIIIAPLSIIDFIAIMPFYIELLASRDTV